MSCPWQENSREEWIDYLDGSLDAHRTAALEQHLAACCPCRELLERLRSARASLVAASQRTDRALVAEAGSLSRIWDGVRFRIRRALAPVDAGEPAIGLDQLRSILAAICGSATAEDALAQAQFRSGPREAEAFASGIIPIVETLSGDRAARLVERAASLVGKARVA